jgi:hypothetical protein
MRSRQALIMRRLRGELAEVPKAVELPEPPVIAMPDSVPLPVIVPDSGIKGSGEPGIREVPPDPLIP